MILLQFSYITFLLLFNVQYARCNRYAEQLYEELLSHYDKNVRPILNATGIIQVKFGASLIRIIDVDEVHQVMTTSLWLEMQWVDYRFKWNPEKWDGIKKLHIPSDHIWIPDIVLYNNADGEPHISITSDALVDHKGHIVWKPPSIYKSFCNINTEYFPYDEQLCDMKFGGWTYHGYLLDVQQLPVNPNATIETRVDDRGSEYQYLEQGMDLSSYYPSAEWDLLSLISERRSTLYPGCCGQDNYIDVKFILTIRRKTLFYTVNLVIPCMLIALLTTFVFYIPPREHKMTYSIQTLVALTVFYLILVELIPPTSLVIPLIGKYLLFTLCLLTASIVISVHTIRVYRKDASADPIPKWMRLVFLQTLPKYLCLKPPDEDAFQDDSVSFTEVAGATVGRTSREPSSQSSGPYLLPDHECGVRLSQLAQLRGMHPDLIRRMIDNVSFIADQFRAFKNENKVSDEWSYVAVVMDRFWHIVFTIINICGTLVIFLQAPSLYDYTLPMRIEPASRPLTAVISQSVNQSSGSFGNGSV